VQLKRRGKKEMNRSLLIVLVLAGGMAAAQGLVAQNPAGTDSSAADKNKPADSQKPSGAAPQSSANPFPGDTSNVPVLPSKPDQAPPEGANYETRDSDAGNLAVLPTMDTDPVRSPDDPFPAASAAEGQESSSSLNNIDSLLPPPDTEQPGKKHRHAPKEEPAHQETAKSDIDVGSFYLDQKNWRAALSRFQSALVLDPEEPEVYWGLAEAERNLGQYAQARQHYERLLEYDPDGKHGKQARKALREPAIAAAQSPAHGQTPSPARQ
jgi:tetratricopeptide (TPR) repeat protein